MNACLMPCEVTPLMLDSRSHLYVRSGDVLYRVRFYTEEELAAQASDSRPVASFYDAELECWVRLEPAFLSEHLG